jgi:hypothetical protein
MRLQIHSRTMWFAFCCAALGMSMCVISSPLVSSSGWCTLQYIKLLLLFVWVMCPGSICIDRLLNYLWLGYPQGFIDSVVKSKGSSRLSEEQKPLGSVYIPYIKSVLEKFRRLGTHYNIRTIFKSKHTLRSSHMKTRPERDPLQRAQCIYSIPCECGRSCIGETGRPLAVRHREHRRNLQQGRLEKSKLAQHTYEEGHRVCWDDSRILEIESNSRYRKYKELALMACSTNPISRPSLDISPIWIPLINNEVFNSQRRSVWRDRFP